MARAPLTEYAAKKIFLGEQTTGISVTKETLSLCDDLSAARTYVVKVDAGIKKRGKQGLLKAGVEKSEVASVVQSFFERGYNRCLVEYFIPHAEVDERYVSIEITREGARIVLGEHGGVDVEEHQGTLKTYGIPLSETLEGIVKSSPLSEVPLHHILKTMAAYQISFLEVNPYIVEGATWLPLDMAALVDTAGRESLPSWVEEHIVSKGSASAEEEAVRVQDAGSQASLNLHTLNPQGSILTLFSGGGASLVAMDALIAAGLTDAIINYSEYSGAPTRDETRAYAHTLLAVLLASSAPRKAIVIAGGVSNFTDIRETFRGLVDAFSDNISALTRSGVVVTVRRGGPHQEEGLAHLREFLASHNIPALVFGPEASLADIGTHVRSQLYDR